MEPLLTVRQCAGLLSLHVKTVYELIAKGQIPGARKIGRSIRIDPKTLERYFETDKTKTKK